MLNKNLLKAAMAKAGYTQKSLAEHVGIGESTLSSRISGKTYFNTEEIDNICLVLQIIKNNEKADIFLGSPSQKRERPTSY